jgi:hypothetical protein
VTPYSLVDRYPCSGGAQLPYSMALHPRRPWHSWEPRTFYVNRVYPYCRWSEHSSTFPSAELEGTDIYLVTSTSDGKLFFFLFIVQTSQVRPIPLFLWINLQKTKTVTHWQFTVCCHQVVVSRVNLMVS